MMTDDPAERRFPATRPRTIVTADPELDDLNSLIRLLLYSNEIEIAGLVSASSRFHWRGDGKGTRFFLPDREYDSPRESWRWAPGERFIEDAVDAYAQVFSNLAAHDERYPRPDALRTLVREGNVDFEGDMSRETLGSQLIAEVLADGRPEPLFLQMWAGPSTVARALRSIEKRTRADGSWESARAEISAKTVILKFASQDATYDEYIRPVWPDIRVIDVATYAWGYLTRQTARAADLDYLRADWMRENVTSLGPLGALYRVWGDGRQMVPGDPTDFFHLSGFTREELQAQGYQAWMDPQPAGEWISEGDTTNMLNLIVPGLRGHEHPAFGGWGGRARRTDIGVDTWELGGVVDTSAGGAADSSLTRWFAAAQEDFAARLRWSVEPDRAALPHPPRVSVEPAADVTAAAGESIELSADVIDPDGAGVAVRWWIYPEAGSCPAEPQLAATSGPRTSVTVPRAAEPGQTIHVILEARGGGSRAMSTWRRVIVTVADAGK